MRNELTAILAATLIAGTAAAQMMAPAAKPPITAAAKPAPVAHKTHPATAKAPVTRTAKSLDCSKQADAKGLHGKPRKGFMSGCKKA